MEIVITGSLGNISKALTQQLVQDGHSVTVISSKAERIPGIETLGAKAAIGTVKDATFLTDIFYGKDAVYLMSPADFTESDQHAYYKYIAQVYKEAIEKSGIKRVINLSSYGAELPSGTGFISASHNIEQILDTVPDIFLTHIRPTYFYYNLFAFIKTIKTKGYIGAVYGGEDKLAMVSPKDIASAIAEEITNTTNFRKVRYVTSDDRTCNEIAQVLGNAIGISSLKWMPISPDVVKQSLLEDGIPEIVADNYVELAEATHSGILREDYERNLPVFGKVKIEDFAIEFAEAYHRE